MASQTRKVYIGITITVALSMAIVLLAPPPMVPGHSFVVGIQSEAALPPPNLAALPQSMIDEANSLAEGLFGYSAALQDEFVAELLATYQAAQDKDMVVFFNTGGLGWDAINETEEGQGFIDGIGAELASLGKNPLLLNYKRTAGTINGGVSEFLLAAGFYPTKSEDLAARVKFLTDHIPGIKVILAGLSNGTLICDGVMKILKDNRRLFSIQMGPPFWNDAASTERTLVLRGNGIIPDSFSQVDLITILRANIEAFFGQSQQHPGDILIYIGAPGHDYRWHYAEVQGRIIDFLRENVWP
jgi:hypothetical protein